MGSRGLDKKRSGVCMAKAVPRAVLNGVIEGLKTQAQLSAVWAGSISFLKTLQAAAGEVPAEDKEEFFRALRAARLEGIENQLHELDVDHERNRLMIAGALKAIAELEEGQCVLELATDAILETMIDLQDATGRMHRELLAILYEVNDSGQERDKKLDAILEKLDGQVARKKAYLEFECKYLESAKEKYGYLELLGIPEHRTRRQPIDVGFITLSLAADGDGHPPRSAQNVFSEHRGLVVEGEAGAGKTTLMQWETFRCCRIPSGGKMTHEEHDEFLREREAPVIPFFIRLREMRSSHDGASFPDHKTWVELTLPKLAATIPENWLDTVLREGRGLLLLDGVDELPPTKRAGFWEELQDLLYTYRDLQFRVTSRHFPREDEKADQWRPPTYPGAQEAVPVVKVQALTPDRRDLLIDQWYDAVVKAEPSEESRQQVADEVEGYARKLKRRIRKPQYRRIFELAETPFLCAAICLINRDRNELLPEGRHELYRMLVVALLNLRDKMRKIETSPLFKKLSEGVLVRLHARLALDMLVGMHTDERAGEDEESAYYIEAPKEDMLRWLDESMALISDLKKYAEAVTEEYCKDHSEEETLAWLANNGPAKTLLDSIVTRCGLLREPVKGRYDFRHRALQEYLGGSAAMRNILDLVNRAHDDRWHDTVILAAGGYNVSESEANRLIKELIDRGDREGLSICYAIAVACLETARDKVDADIEELALSKLEELVPPRDEQDAKTLAAAGEHVVPLLPYDEHAESEIIAASAETLARIDSEKAAAQLRQGYWEDGRLAICLEVVKCPGINALAMPALLRGVPETKRLRLPEYALEYVSDLSPLKELPELVALDLCDCNKVTDLAPLGTLPLLEELDLTGLHAITDVGSLGSLANLRWLSLADCRALVDLGGLEGLVNLEYLDLSRCASLEDLRGLKGFSKLKALSLRGCPKLKFLP